MIKARPQDAWVQAVVRVRGGAPVSPSPPNGARGSVPPEAHAPGRSSRTVREGGARYRCVWLSGGDHDEPGAASDLDQLAGLVGGDVDRGHSQIAGDVGGLAIAGDREVIRAGAHVDWLAGPVAGGADRGHGA